ncbi:MAG: rhodanese-like domain-containing protein [Bacteroidetes bacterium CHB5]|nr:rhodanese-like domain-containing protein [Bacteroidetes bacterium CHB5]
MTTMKRLSSLAFVLLMVSAACTQAQQDSILPVADFEKQVAATKEKVVLDVRTPDEYNRGHLPDAKLMNVNDGNFKQQLSTLQKDKPVYVYCAAGVRSNKAAKIMRQEGFTQVFELKGGLQAWQAAGKPVTK